MTTSIVIDPRIEIVFGEFLSPLGEEVVGIENVVGRAIRLRVGIEDSQPKLIYSARGKRKGPLHSLSINESWKLCTLIVTRGANPGGTERVIDFDRNVLSADTDIRITEIAPSLSLSWNRH